jgi:cytochrome b6-f complex iron-sulfur subunit
MEEHAPGPQGRRHFFKGLLAGLAGLWGTGLLASLVLYLKAPRRHGSGLDSAVAVGLLDELPPGQGQMVTGAHRPFWLVRSREGELVALPAVCTHRRCILQWDGGSQLLCPCHQGVFDLNGNVLAGPPPRALDKLAVTVKGGRVYVYP